MELDSVDGFQGREKEAVLISCVRSNGTGVIGFLVDTRRMNVALTRARRKLIVVGDSATLGGHAFYASLFSYFESSSSYRSRGDEELDEEKDEKDDIVQGTAFWMERPRRGQRTGTITHRPEKKTIETPRCQTCASCH